MDDEVGYSEEQVLNQEGTKKATETLGSPFNNFLILLGYAAILFRKHHLPFHRLAPIIISNN
jgi:hypothetical protein